MWPTSSPRRTRTGGYRRFAWTREDHDLREWFAGEAADARPRPRRRPRRQPVGLVGRPGRAAPAGRRRHSAPTWTRCPTAAPSTARSAWSSALAAVDVLRARGFRPARPLGVVNFADEEGARFGVACAGSRLLTGALDRRPGARPDRRRRGHAWPRRCARPAATRPTSAATTRRCAGSARSSSCTSSRAAAWSTSARRSASAAASGRTAAGGSSCRARPTTPAPPGWPTGTTRCSACAAPVLAARAAAERHGARRDLRQGRGRAERRQRDPVAGHRVARRPRRPTTDAVRAVVAERRPGAVEARRHASSRSRGRPPRAFDAGAGATGSPRCSATAPVLATGAGHDAGILAAAGVPTRDAVRPQPDRGLALAGRARRARRLPGRGRGAGRACVERPGRREPAADRPALAPTRAAARRAARDVRAATVDGGRFTAVDPRRGAAVPATRGCRARAARVRQRPLARLPPGAARAHARPAAARSGPGASGCTPSPRRLDPDTLPRAGPRRLRRDGAGRRHRVGEFHYLHHAPGRHARTTTRTRWARRWCRPPREAGIRHHPARHLLPRRRSRRRTARCRWRGRSGGSATATPTPGPSGVAATAAADRRTLGSARPCTRCGPCRATQLGRSSTGAAGRRRCTSTCPSSRPRTSACPRPTACTPTELLDGAGRARPADAPRCTPPT